MPTHPSRGIILFAHGSRDPLWQKPIEAVADKIRSLAPSALVRCAYLELSAPDLASSAAELVALGVGTIRITPLFLGVGRHAREDLPVLLGALREQYPHIVFDLKPAIGEEAQLIELIAQIALS